ncbi:crooked neck, partial [Strigomonas culicis]
MKRSRNDNKTFGPAAAAMRRRHIYRDMREAETQLSARQLIDDAVAMHKFQAPSSTSSTKVLIRSREELALYRLKRRAELDEKVNRGYKFLGNWVKYARWEAQQKDFVRMRQVLERATAFHGDNPKFWRDYAELEQQQGFLGEARAVWGRGLAALPHAADLWLKAALMEQAAGDVGRARDLLQRWTTLPSPPPFAFELFVLLEVQSAVGGQHDRVRDVLRRYVEHANTPEAWLFYAATEADALQHPSRAVQVLETAREALPAEALWTSAEHRVPLRLAQLYAAEGRKEDARALYRELLERLDRPARGGVVVTVSSSSSSSTCNDAGSAAAPAVVDQRVVADLLAAYAQFERLAGGADAAAVEALTRLQAARFYEQRLRENPQDLDSRLSLYLLLRRPGASAEEQAAALACLRGATAVPLQGGDPYRAQQAVVLLMEYARACEAAGEAGTAQQVLSQALQRFPFVRADCPRLWQEAAALEERLGHVDQARKMLRAAMHVTKDTAVVDALLQLEERAYARGSFTDREAYLAQLRGLYRDVLKLDPLRVSSWVGFAKLEEREGQAARAQAVYEGAVRTLTAEACKQLRASFAYRYELLDQVDQLWGRRMALGQRALRRLR